MAPFRFLLLSLPFSGVGVELGGTFFSSGFIGYALFLLASLKWFSLPYLPKVSLTLLVFLSACLISNIFKNPLASFVGPFLVLSFFAFPFFLRVNCKLKVISLLPSLKLSFILLNLTLVAEVILYMAYGLNPSIYSLLGIHGSTIEYYGIPRLRGFQTEPSILSYIAIFYLIAFNHLSRFARISAIYRYFPIMIVMSSMSSSGILFLTCVGLGLILTQRKISYSNYKIIVIPVLAVLLLLLFPGLVQPVAKAFYRIADIFEVILTSNASGSVGYRVHSIIEPIFFYANADIISLFTGTGFSNYSNYIYEKYHHLDYSGFASGDLNSIFSAVAISTGIIGLVPFMFFCYTAFRSPESNLFADTKFLFIIFLFLSYGNMSAPFIWIILYVFFWMRKAATK